MSHKIPILMYHSITKVPKDSVMRSLHVPPKRFALQMRMLKVLGYKGLSMKDLHPYLTGEKVGKVVGLTFDDGYRNNLNDALPVLTKLGFSATCYLISNKLGQYNDWDEDKGIARNELMTENEVFSWLSAGMDIGAHSEHHVDLTTCAPEELTREIIGSKQTLETLFDYPVEHFCYPYGKYNKSVIEATRAAGFTTSTTMKRGRVIPIESPSLELPRIPVVHHTLPHLFLLKCLSNYEDKRG
ncbi:polysaccharide deacetylase family protein [Neptuniibacter caesariensis]|uniref:NodB homology domain-containing protein n=1 Tax=Neptuniibacter caesariensis TaxID=207954 RepID=A0A7U8C776_NEPCE|nr:polysaccharide deacetylase family protein [Neptuniibacter caesariensis]EAR62850.1 hypothetical protein MED92_07021 [Oceanospirillum sp. MED92] [Neptuniibacter caesariensis]